MSILLQYLLLMYQDHRRREHQIPTHRKDGMFDRNKADIAYRWRDVLRSPLKDG
tara:strand:- start:436 stop:597 length:162 start_codon:yes stop_codon:yes gene_type:complete